MYVHAFESSGSRRGLHFMVVGSFVGAVILFSLSGQEGMPMPFIWQFLGLACLTAGVYLLALFSLRAYRYAIEPSGVVDAEGIEQYDLVVTEIVGKKRRVVSRIGLRDIDRTAVTVIRTADGEAGKEKKAALCQGRQVFRYVNSPLFPEACYIPIPEEGAVLVIPVDPTMTRILRGDPGPVHQSRNPHGD